MLHDITHNLKASYFNNQNITVSTHPNAANTATPTSEPMSALFVNNPTKTPIPIAKTINMPRERANMGLDNMRLIRGGLSSSLIANWT
jgi:hypothetical protein